MTDETKALGLEKCMRDEGWAGVADFIKSQAKRIEELGAKGKADNAVSDKCVADLLDRIQILGDERNHIRATLTAENATLRADAELIDKAQANYAARKQGYVLMNAQGIVVWGGLDLPDTVMHVTTIREALAVLGAAK